jgi:hypothetical protein
MGAGTLLCFIYLLVFLLFDMRGILLKCIGVCDRSSLASANFAHFGGWNWSGEYQAFPFQAKRGDMTQNFLVAAVLLCFGLGLDARAQVNSSVGGTVEDSSKALIPGVTITATNTQTGVTNTVISNESGAYNFAALLPGIYRVSAELPGFKTYTYNDVQLSAGTPVRLNFTLEVGGVAQAVEVTVEAGTLLATSSPSIGEVLSEKRVVGLPITSNNALDLVRILPGFRESPGGNAFDTFAGLPSSTVNTVRDGLSVTDGRFNNGVFSTTTINPDLVGEVRLILTPVDAELGRGSAQVQIFTRSGTNQLRGSAVWNIQNSALDPNTWLNNHTIDPVTGKAATRNWTNQNEYSVSAGGPIKKNKTFFYTLWEQQIHRERNLVDGGVLTDAARLGIFRYFDGWNPQRYGVPNTATPTTSATRVITAVDAFGNPVAPTVNADGTPYSGLGLQCFSVFGTRRLGPGGNMVAFWPGDCPGGSMTLRNNGAALAYLLSGSLDAVEQAYWIDSYQDVQDGKWQSLLTSKEPYREIIINEMAAFAKDDWKITRNLTLNLGLRWEYYGSRYVKGGYATTPGNLGVGLLGINRSTGGTFDNWLLSGTPIFLSGYGNTVPDANALQCTSGAAQPNLPTSNCNKDFLHDDRLHRTRESESGHPSYSRGLS